jgi:hypothetical protein
LRCTYGKLEEMLRLMPSVRETLGLRNAPRRTTIQAF